MCPCYATVQVFAIDPCQYVHILIMDIRKLTLVNKNENMQNSMRKIIFNIFKWKKKIKLKRKNKK